MWATAFERVAERYTAVHVDTREKGLISRHKSVHFTFQKYSEDPDDVDRPSDKVLEVSKLD